MDATSILGELEDLEARIRRADSLLLHIADQRSRTGRNPEDLDEVRRLQSKANGLRLTLSYIHEMPSYRWLVATRQAATARANTEVVTPTASPAIPTGRMAGSESPLDGA